MICLYWKEDRIYRGWPARLAGSIITCSADGHDPHCAGLRKDCDKEPYHCPEAVMQGPDAWCKVMKELCYSCKGDIHWCELTDVEKQKLMACR